MATPEPAMYSSSTTTETPGSDKSHHRRPGIHHQPNLKELRQSTMDSSGYSSSEDPNRKPTRSATNSTSRTDGSGVAGYRHRINSAFFSLMGPYKVLVCFHVCVQRTWLFINHIVFYVLNRLRLINGYSSTLKNDACSSSRYGVVWKWCLYFMLC